MTAPTNVQPQQVPAAIRDYLAAHEARDANTALRAFTPAAVVVDDGTTYHGREEIHDFLSRAGAQFTYTTTRVAAERTDDAHWVITNHLQGNFPGGAVDLRYQFTMDHDLIAELVIAP
jgi:ketosteroid isomerase-like protein